MIETLFEGQEYINSAKRMGLYGALLGWVAAQRRGEFYPWPQLQQVQAPPPARQIPTQPQHATPVMRINDSPPNTTTLAKAPPPRRAMDYLHEAYQLLGIDDSKPLTHEALKSAYKRAAVKTHPDKGGSPELFDAVTRAFLYIQEILEKLIPKTGKDGKDVRFSVSVTPEEAMKARGIIHQTAPADKNAMKLEDAPPIALNPKKLDMNVFNKLFEENKLPDPDKDDGYGDWLKEQDNARGTQAAMKGKYNADVFNRTFEEEAKRSAAAPQNQLSKYKPPSEMILAPGFGTELGAGRPEQYTKTNTAITGNAGGIGYTDLKYAYSEGSTFSQDIAGVSLDGRPKTMAEAERAYKSAPGAMSEEEARAVSVFQQAREAAELQRQQRLASRDVDHSTAHARLKQRLMIAER
jgi:DnaJ domain